MEGMSLSTTLEVIIRAKDQLSQTVDKVNQKLKQTGDTSKNAMDTAKNATNQANNTLEQQTTHIEKVSNKYQELRSKIVNAFQQIRNTIKNTKPDMDTQGLTTKFSNAAESIRNKWRTLMQNIQSNKAKPTVDTTGIKQGEQAVDTLRRQIVRINSMSASPRFEITTLKNAEGEMQVILKDLQQLKSQQINFNTDNAETELKELSSMLDRVIERKQKLNSPGLDPFSNISTAGLQILNGEMTTAAEKLTTTTQKTGLLRSGMSSLSSSLVTTGTTVKQLSENTGALGRGFTVLKGALSGVIAMVGYQLASSLVESTRASINARGNIESFSKRLGMSQTEVNSFTQELSKLQKEFKKVDMQSVGATALELAVKLDVPKNKINDLTKTVAVMSSAFAREGRTSTDAMLAVSDALDGQFRRLQEIGVTQEMLKNNGWDGNIENTTGLIDALNKTMDKLGLEETARQVTNLDDAWAVLNVALSQLLTEIILPLLPALVGLISAVSDLANAVANWWKNMPDGGKIAILVGVLGALSYVITGRLIVAIMDLIPALIGGEVAALPLIITFLEVAAVVGAVAFVIYEVGKAMGWWTDGASAMQVIGEALGNVFNTIVACLTAVYNGFMQVASPAIQEFWNFLVEAVTPLQGTLANLWGTLLRIGDAFGGASGSGSLFATIGRIIGEIFKTVLFNLEVFIAFLVPAIKLVINVISSLIGFVIDLCQAFSLLTQGDIIGFLEGLGGAIYTLVKNLAVHIGGALVDLGHNLIDILGQSFPDLAVIVQTEMDNIVNTISSSAKYIVGALLDLGGQMWEGLLDALGIHSPGHMANAIKDEMAHIVEFILNAIPNAIRAIISFGVKLIDNLKDALGKLPEMARDMFGEGAGQIVETIIGLIIPCLTTLQLILGEFMIYLGQIIDAISLLMEGDYEGFFNLLISAITTFITNVGEYITLLILYIWNYFGQIRDYIIQVAFDAVTGFLLWISSLPGQLWAWLLIVLQNAWNWAVQFKNYIVNAALNAVNGFIAWISTLPGKLWQWLLDTINKVISWASQFVEDIKKAAKDAVDKFKEKLNLKKVMEDEINNIKTAIENGVGKVCDAMSNFAHSLWNSFKNGLDQHSPGRIARGMAAEMTYTEEAVHNAVTPVTKAIDNLTGEMVESFDNTRLDDIHTLMEESIPDDFNLSPYASVTPEVEDDTMALDTGMMDNVYLDSIVSTDMTSITDSMLNMTNTVNPQLGLIIGTLNTMGLTSTTNTTTALQNNNSITMSYQQMQQNINASLQNLMNTNTIGWNNIRNVTTTSLNSMLSSTRSVTAQMISAWQTMKNSIIQAANDIKTQSSSRFDSLWSTIKTFYNRIQHPGGAGAPVRGRRSSGSSNGFTSFRNAIHNTLGNRQGSVTRQTFNNTGIPRQEIEYIFPSTNNRIGVSDVKEYLAFMAKMGAGNWSDAVNPNVKWIREETNKWKTAPPTIANRYKTSKGFKVGDFENGEPQITFPEFQQMAEDVFSKIDYCFYFDSAKYGHWIPAFHAGLMNCSDSTDALCAMADACGLPNSKVHGYWNSIGHFWANIAGHKMDTTGWMLHRTWTPSQSHAGPAPRLVSETRDDTQSLLMEILSYLKQKEDDAKSDHVVTHDGKITLNVECRLSGDVPEGVTSEDVAGMLGDLILDKKVLKAIASSADFQEYDNRYKERLNGKRARFS